MEVPPERLFEVVLLRLRHKPFPPYISAFDQAQQDRLFINSQYARWPVETSDKTLAIRRVDRHEPVLALLQLHTFVVESGNMKHWELSSVPILHSDLLRQFVEVNAAFVEASAKAPVLVNLWQ